MIRGTVNDRLEAVIGVQVLDDTGQPTLVQAVIDTGFTGDLTLPPTLIAKFGLTQSGEFEAQLADGSISRVQYFSAVIDWDGTARATEIILIDSNPLLGMRLLEGSRLVVDVAVGGNVIIEPLR